MSSSSASLGVTTCCGVLAGAHRVYRRVEIRVQTRKQLSVQPQCYICTRRSVFNTMHRIYLDHNATTPPAPEVVDRLTAALREQFGNPSSVHHFGQQSKAVLDDARSAVAALVGSDPSEVVFTSGGTESDNFAIRGVAEALEVTGRKHLIATTIEHEAVLNTLKALGRRGWTVTLLPVDETGIVATEALTAALTPQTAL